MSMGKICLNGALVAALVASYLFCAANVFSSRAELPAESQRAEVLMVSPSLLEVISGEFKGLWADYLVLKASIFLGGYNETTPEDWDTIYLLFKQSLALDPYFFTTSYYCQAFLAWRKQTIHNAIELLKVSEKHRSWDWQPSFFLGFNYYYFLNDNKTAAKYLSKAAQHADAPPLAATLGAKLAQKAGRTAFAIEMLSVLYDKTQDESTKKILEDRIKAHYGILILEQAIEAYNQKYGFRPESLKALVEKGFLTDLPENPFAPVYYYNPLMGKVYFEKSG